MKINTLYEDDFYVAIDKPAGILSVTIPGKSEKQVTDFIDNSSAYLVHRLDRYTSGVLLLAKSRESLDEIQKQFKERKINKIYKSLVFGIPPEAGKINSPLKRREKSRMKFRVSGSQDSRNALTEFKRIKTFDSKVGKFSLLSVKIFTGRTHQIRVHLSSIKFPVVCDDEYGRKKENKKIAKKIGLKRQFLHAETLGFKHPFTGKEISILSDLPEELKTCLEKIQA